MAIRAIALDIDGTLTNDQKVITPRTKKALMDAQEAGIKLILSSGRPVHGLRALAHELELDRHNGLLVAFNGALYSHIRILEGDATESLTSAAAAW